MGTGYGAPGGSTQLGWSGQPLLASPSGITVVPGNLLLGRTTKPGTLLLDVAQFTPNAEDFALFAPGVVAAKTLGVWHNRYIGKRVAVQGLEINALTAQTTGDPVNYWGLVVTDTLGNTLTLPMSAANQKHYFLDQGLDAQIIQSKTSAPAVANNMTGSYASFTPTSNVTISGMKGPWIASSSLGSIVPRVGAQIRGTILDTNGNILAQGTATQLNDNAGMIEIGFGAPLSLVAGTPYIIMVDVQTTALSTFLATSIAVGSGAPVGLAIANNNAGSVGNVTTAVGAKTGHWQDTGQIFPQTAYLPGAARDGFVSKNSGGNGDYFSYQPSGATPPFWALVGQSLPTVYAGDLTLSFVATGAPIGTAAPSDVNVRAVLQALPS